MTFYIGSSHENFEYGDRGLYIGKSTGIVYEVYEQRYGDNLRVAPRTAPSGIMTSVLIDKYVTKRLPHPYGNCVESTEIGYNMEACIIICIEAFVKDKCKCPDSPFLSQLNKMDNDKLNYCHSLHQSQSQLLTNHKCVQSQSTSIWISCFKTCQIRCITVRYTTDSTYSKWPLPGQYDSFYDQIISTRLFAKTFDHMFMRNNTMGQIQSIKGKIIANYFVHIEFNLNFNKYLQYEEVPKYTVFSLIGTLGGGLNLWSGITVLVFIEMAETLIKILRTLYKR